MRRKSEEEDFGLRDASMLMPVGAASLSVFCGELIL